MATRGQVTTIKAKSMQPAVQIVEFCLPSTFFAVRIVYMHTNTHEGGWEDCFHINSEQGLVMWIFGLGFAG